MIQALSFLIENNKKTKLNDSRINETFEDLYRHQILKMKKHMAYVKFVNVCRIQLMQTCMIFRPVDVHLIKFNRE